jgi:hypothetical protein
MVYNQNLQTKGTKMAFGWEDIEGGIICDNCSDNPMYNNMITEADPIGYPDGYTCADCGDTYGDENYNAE